MASRNTADLSAHELEVDGLRVGGPKVNPVRRYLPYAVVVVSALLCFGFALEFWRNVFVGHGTPGKSPAPSPPANISELTPQFFPSYGSRRVKIRYGPFNVPAMSVSNGMKEFGERTAVMPCTDCFVTWLQAGLEYPDGMVANADSGMWLHHTVWSNTGANATVCNWRGDRFFASGNERTAVDLCVGGTTKVGYYIPPHANFGYVAELMNMKDFPRDTFLTMTWEFIPYAAAGFDKVESIWLDIGGCGSSEKPAKEHAQFEYSSPGWKSNVTGHVVFTAGHLHDGGTHLVVRKNGETICDSHAGYGKVSHHGGLGKRHDHDHEMQHISSMSDCSNAGIIVDGDELALTAYYDTTKWKPMTNMDGSLEPIMGIALVYVA